jgi:lipopolysaccharide/colanic/teichoic acid biosynthesis glycosyltransferase
MAALDHSAARLINRDTARSGRVSQGFWTADRVPCYLRSEIARPSAGLTFQWRVHFLMTNQAYRHHWLVLADTALFYVSSVLAFYIRTPFEAFDLFETLTSPYVLTGTAFVFLGLHAAGSGREIWNLSTTRVFGRILMVVALAIFLSLAMTFTLTRLEGVPRSIPLLQLVFSGVLLILARLLAQQHARIRRTGGFQPLSTSGNAQLKSQSVIIVGVNNLTGVMLRLIEAHAPEHLDVVGFVTISRKQLGRTAFGHRILGHVNAMAEIRATLQTHGVEVRHVLLAVPRSSIPAEGLAQLNGLVQSGDLVFLELADLMSFSSDSDAADEEGTDASDALEGGAVAGAALPQPAGFRVDDRDLEAMAQRPYWLIKRGLDIALSALALLLVSPLLVLIALLVAARMGRPVLFWQRRPGMGGKPFHVLKFRTMRAEVDPDGRRLTDQERMNALGNLLRRSRLDELPQLINILRGDMSIVGPRPLLPRDLAEGHTSRLVVRPGLTGWAQVIGGRAISAEDKAALDIWYVHSASIALDLRIMLKTVPMVLFGEKVDHGAVASTLSELRRMSGNRP